MQVFCRNFFRTMPADKMKNKSGCVSCLPACGTRLLVSYCCRSDRIRLLSPIGFFFSFDDIFNGVLFFSFNRRVVRACCCCCCIQTTSQPSILPIAVVFVVLTNPCKDALISIVSRRSVSFVSLFPIVHVTIRYSSLSRIVIVVVGGHWKEKTPANTDDDDDDVRVSASVRRTSSAAVSTTTDRRMDIQHRRYINNVGLLAVLVG